jgi:hypothetical protein
MAYGAREDSILPSRTTRYEQQRRIKNRCDQNSEGPQNARNGEAATGDNWSSLKPVSKSGPDTLPMQDCKKGSKEFHDPSRERINAGPNQNV